MKDPIGILTLRLQAVLDSETDAQFYENVHGYMDVVFKTPALDEIMKKAEKEYSRVAIQILDANHEQRSSMLMRNERFNLFARDFCNLLNIYEPIEDYKNHPLDPDSAQDPNALLLLKGFKYLNKAKTGAFNKDFNKGITHSWKGKRVWYKQKLQRFHIDLVTEIGKSETRIFEVETIPKEKEPFTLNPRTGDFTFLNTTGNISPSSNMFKVLNTLFLAEDNQADYLTIVQSYSPTIDEVYKAHKDALSIIIRDIKKELSILPKTANSNPDIIKNIQKYGYRLNFKDLGNTPE